MWSEVPQGMPVFQENGIQAAFPSGGENYFSEGRLAKIAHTYLYDKRESSAGALEQVGLSPLRNRGMP
jgi:hypothetical protein